jgi:hypothetical protein
MVPCVGFQHKQAENGREGKREKQIKKEWQTQQGEKGKQEK